MPLAAGTAYQIPSGPGLLFISVAEADDPETTGGLDSRRAAITDRPGERLSRPPVYDLKEPIRPTGQPSRLPSHLASANGGDE